MPWIKVISPDEAKGDLKEIYQTIASARGGIAEVHQSQSLNPRALSAHLELYRAIVFQRSSLSRIHRERIAVVVSAVNRCVYCVTHHSETLRQLGEKAPILESLRQGNIPNDLAPADVALLQWAKKAAASPSDSSSSAIQELRSFGWDDRAILDATLTVAYFSFVNRIVLLLGVQVESDYSKTCGNPAENSL